MNREIYNTFWTRILEKGFRKGWEENNFALWNKKTFWKIIFFPSLRKIKSWELNFLKEGRGGVNEVFHCSILRHPPYGPYHIFVAIKLRQYQLSKEGCCMPALGCSESQGAYTILTILKINNHSTLLDLQGCDIVLFLRNTQHRHCHTSHGPHRWTSHHSCYQQRVPSGDQGGLPLRLAKKPSTATMTKLITDHFRAWPPLWVLAIATVTELVCEQPPTLHTIPGTHHKWCTPMTTSYHYSTSLTSCIICRCLLCLPKILVWQQWWQQCHKLTSWERGVFLLKDPWRSTCWDFGGGWRWGYGRWGAQMDRRQTQIQMALQVPKRVNYSIWWVWVLPQFWKWNWPGFI